MTGGWVAAEPALPDVIRRIQQVVFWRDRRWLERHALGAVLERDYVPGEFWSEHHFREPEGVIRVQVWWIDLFQDAASERGFIRCRKAVAATGFVTHDAEEAANWMFRAGPPDDDVLPDGPIPELPRTAWRPSSGWALHAWPAVRWAVSPDYPQDGVDAVREAFAPALDDLAATTDIGLTVVLDSRVLQLGAWSALILPPEATRLQDVTSGKAADDRFAAWESVDIRMLDPFIAAVESAANAVQSYVLPRLWASTGRAEWPVCPIHWTHPLWSRRQRESAVWECPTNAIEVPIGQLPRTH